jgi:hypothetical protein
MIPVNESMLCVAGLPLRNLLDVIMPNHLFLPFINGHSFGWMRMVSALDRFRSVGFLTRLQFGEVEYDNLRSQHIFNYRKRVIDVGKDKVWLKNPAME